MRVMVIMLLILLNQITFSGVPQNSSAPFPKYSTQLNKSLQNVFHQGADVQWIKIGLSTTIKTRLKNHLRIKKTLPDTIILGKIDYQNQPYWVILDEAPSKTRTFLYALYLTRTGKIFDVDVLIYRENYGYEIDHPAFRKQFRGKQKAREIIFGRNIQNITGATISARSLTYAIQDWLKIFEAIRSQLPDKEENE